MTGDKQLKSVLDKTDYPGLTLGHPQVSVTDVTIVGLHLKVYGLREIEGNERGVAVLIAAHGRMNSQKNMAPFAQGILGEVAGRPDEQRKRDLIVVTLDQRNHGGRIVDRQANLAYDQNPRHLLDMAATVCGGCHDVQLVMDFLAAYIFPHGEKQIGEFIMTGISLGGHVTWRLLREEPRIKIGIPIIGLPFESFPKYMGPRAASLSIPFEPPTYPPSLRPLLEGEVDHTSYQGKKILSLHGAEDTLVPLEKGRADIDEVMRVVNASAGGRAELWSQDGAGHVCSPEMLRRTADWIWTHGLCKGQEAKM
ncbi:hypothetical protein IAU60_005922 [Kwoniella sp. DSM 27419]